MITMDTEPTSFVDKNKGVVDYKSTSEAIDKPRVQFQSMVDVVAIEDISSYSEEELEACWYSGAELKQMKQNNGDNSIDYDDRLAEKEESVSAVLLEQDSQWENEVENPEMIATIYSQLTAENQRLAYKRGLTEEYDVLRAQRKESRSKSSGSMKKSASFSGKYLSKGLSSRGKPTSISGNSLRRSPSLPSTASLQRKSLYKKDTAQCVSNALFIVAGVNVQS